MKDNIIYTDSEDYYSKINNIKNEGIENLHFLVDFDNTLTKAFVDGIRVPSLISVLRGKNGLLGVEIANKDIELFKKYHPKEIDPKLSIDEKKKYMELWWKESFELLIKGGLTKDILKQIGKTDDVKLRNGVKDFFKFLDKNNIPIIIMSASGIGKLSIEYFLESQGILNKNVKIISNDFVWDDSGKAIDYKKPIIHSFNKSELNISTYTDIYNEIKNKKNVILIGDSLGDHHMIDGFDYNNLVNIGFLNDKIDELIEEYKKRYDILILNDGDFSFINNLL